MTKRILSKTLPVLLAFLMVFSCLSTAVFAAGDDDDLTPEDPVVTATEDPKKGTKDLGDIGELLNSNKYSEYRLLYEDQPKGTDDVTLKGSEYDAAKTTAAVLLRELDPSVSGMVCIPETGDVTWNFSVNKTGNYHIAITYYPIVALDSDGDGAVDMKSNNANIERAILLDGTYPFRESRYIELSRVWGETAGDEKVNDRGFVEDNDGSEIKPNKVEMPEVRTAMAQDSTGYIVDPFLYYIEAGEHTLTLAEVQEPVGIVSIRIYYDDSVSTYAEYIAENNKKQDNASGGVQMLEAEKSHRTSSNIIYPVYDRTSAITSPQSASQIFLNSIGGEKWETVGQWVSWLFEVPADGYYTIAPRFVQSFAEGMYCTREIKIDGVTPFSEAKFLRFKYDDDWQLLPLTDGVIDATTGRERELKFYLTAGTHELELCVALGNMADILTRVENSLAKINEYYLQILMLTGSDPDEYRDYKFGRLMPEVLVGMLEEAENLYTIADQLAEINGTKGSDSITLENVALLLERMGGDEDLIAANFDELKDYIGSLGTWIMTARNQPLQFDYILIYPAKSVANADETEDFLDDAGYRATAGFWSAFAYEMKQFFMSWVSDYSSYGVRTSIDAAEFTSIEVWTTSGRDQAQIIRSLISDSFTKNNNIAVELKLVAAGSLLPATLSGSGPDINMTVASGTVINYAIRSAVMPINPAGYVDKEGDDEETRAKNAECREIFSDYDEIMKRFADAATIPLQLYGVAYGLPETEHFSMLFYRSDILLQLGLEIPETWDDVYNMLPTLQTNNLQFGYHESLAGLLILLYQRGEQLYKGTDRMDPYYGMQINLDSNTALETFKDLCELYTMYGFPYSYSFVNRFRTGEMPIGVAQYTIYSQLTIYAPELRGLWGFTILPGTVRTDENGNTIIDHTADTTITGTIMMRDCKDVKAAWEYMKWWSSAETQSTYGQEYYALLGASGQYATANRDALFGMSWTADERTELLNQFDGWLRATPEMPGGYIVARNVEFAFLRAYNDDDDPVEALLSYVDTINAELSRKRAEFGLPTAEDVKKSAEQS